MALKGEVEHRKVIKYSKVGAHLQDHLLSHHLLPVSFFFLLVRKRISLKLIHTRFNEHPPVCLGAGINKCISPLPFK